MLPRNLTTLLARRLGSRDGPRALLLIGHRCAPGPCPRSVSPLYRLLLPSSRPPNPARCQFSPKGYPFSLQGRPHCVCQATTTPTRVAITIKTGRFYISKSPPGSAARTASVCHPSGHTTKSHLKAASQGTLRYRCEQFCRMCSCSALFFSRLWRAPRKLVHLKLGRIE